MRFSLSRSRQTTGEYQQVLAWQTFVLTTYCCVIVAVPRHAAMSGAGKIESGLGLQLLVGYSPRALVFAATHSEASTTDL